MLQLDQPIETARLTIRPFLMSDLEQLYAMHRLPEVVRYLYTDTRDRDETRQALEAKIRRSNTLDEAQLHLAALRRDTGELVGDLVIFIRSPEHAMGEIGYIFHPDHQGLGFATEAALELLRIGFERLRLHRVIARCDARNHGSYRVMERLGMRREAHFVENESIKGEWTDELVYAMLEREWVARPT
ncbi:MAG: GNAT family N-acetyltransferase [Candidatus Limnocylindrales bacterium]